MIGVPVAVVVHWDGMVAEGAIAPVFPSLCAAMVQLNARKSKAEQRDKACIVEEGGKSSSARLYSE